MKKKTSKSLWVQRKACLKAAKKCVYCLLYIYLHEWRKTISRKGLNLGRFYLKKTYPQVHSKLILISCLMRSKTYDLLTLLFLFPSTVWPIPICPASHPLTCLLNTHPTPSPLSLPPTSTQSPIHIIPSYLRETHKVSSYLLIINPRPVLCGL